MQRIGAGVDTRTTAGQETGATADQSADFDSCSLFPAVSFPWSLGSLVPTFSVPTLLVVGVVVVVDQAPLAVELDCAAL
jgi:hypothetical protein